MERVHRKVSFNGIHSVFSVPLVPFERANRSVGKKRNEFRSTTPRLRVLGKGQNWLMVAHQLASAYNYFQRSDTGLELGAGDAAPFYKSCRSQLYPATFLAVSRVIDYFERILSAAWAREFPSLRAASACGDS